MTDEWYFTSQGQQKGPVSTAELKQLAAASQLQPTDLVWREGMAGWVPARSAKGLFPEPVPGAVPVAATPVAPLDEGEDLGQRRPRRRRDEDDYDRPRRRRDEDEDDFDEAPRRRRSRSAGSNKGLIIGLVAGGVGLVVVGIIVVVLIIVLGGSSTGNYTVNLGPGQWDVRNVTFTAGKEVDIRVTSDQNTDVDLHVLDNRGQTIAADISIGPNSYIHFRPPYSGRYQLKVINLDPFQGNRSHVSY